MNPGRGVDWLQKKLPVVKLGRFHESALYGIDEIIANSVGYKIPLPTKTSWQHGWCWDPILHPKQVTGQYPPELPRLVAQPKHADYLRDQGFVSAHAVGMPFIYSAAGRPITRVPDSLLVMPPHSLTWLDEDWDDDLYADYVSSLKSKFSCVVACISSACVQNGNWVGAFERAGIPWISGALINDVNSLMRMHIILQSFEYVTTNNIGSHIPYAAFSGCKVSIAGPYMTWATAPLLKEPFYRDNPDLVEATFAKWQEPLVRQYYPELFCDPWDAPLRREWGEEQLGFSSKRSPEEIAELFGWNWRLHLTERVRRSCRDANYAIRGFGKKLLPKSCVTLVKKMETCFRAR